MIDMSGLYEALEKASQAVERGCAPTARAAMIGVHRALLDAINATSGKLRDRADSAYVRLLGLSQGKKIAEAIEILYVFWDGFEDGWDEVERDNDTEAYREGYDFGMHGARQPYVPEEDADDDLYLDEEDGA